MIRLTVTFAFLSLLLPASAAVDFQPLSYPRDSQATFQRAGLRVYGTTADECDDKLKQMATLQDVVLFGEDDRRSLTKSEQTDYEYGGMFEFRMADGSIGVASGTLVTPIMDNPNQRNFDLILTSAHNFYDENCKLISDEYVYAVQNEFPVKIDVKNIHLEKPCTGKFDSKYDRAIVVVPRIKRNGRYVKTVGLANFTEEELIQRRKELGEDISLLAYNSESQKMNLSENCRVHSGSENSRRNFGEIITNDCDSVAGASGGGLLLKHNNEKFLIGIHQGSNSSLSSGPKESGQTHEFDASRKFNISMGLSNGFVELIRNVSQQESAKQNTI